jgi:hypothetical protein
MDPRAAITTMQSQPYSIFRASYKASLDAKEEKGREIVTFSGKNYDFYLLQINNNKDREAIL